MSPKTYYMSSSLSLSASCGTSFLLEEEDKTEEVDEILAGLAVGGTSVLALLNVLHFKSIIFLVNILDVL